MAKEKLADTDHVDLDQVRELVNTAHHDAKEVIVELRDLARGIHPPALDIGLEGALSTPGSPQHGADRPPPLTLHDRPTPAIESIALLLCGRASGQTWPSTPKPPEPASCARSTASGCAWSCATTEWAVRDARGWVLRRVD